MRAPILLATAAFTGCVYSFDNPVASQASGTVTGRVVLDGGAPGQTVAGTQVDLLWSALSVKLDASGRFAFLGLPDGTYTLRYTVPPPAPNDFPAAGEQLDVYLPFTAGGAADTLALGDIPITAAGKVEGNVVGQGSGVVVGAFTPDSDGGVGEYEGYSTATDDGGHYAFYLPAGQHQLWASTPTQSGTLTLKLPAGADLSGQDFQMQTPAFSQAQLSGYLVIDPNGAHAPQNDVQGLLEGLTLDVTLDPAGDAGPLPPPSFSFETPAPAEGVSAVRMNQSLPPGALYDVVYGLPSVTPPVPAVPVTGIPVIAGRTTLLRQIVLLRQSTLQQSGALAFDGGAPGPDAGGDAGPPTWLLVDRLPDPGADAGVAADAILPLPLPGGFHELVLSESALFPGSIQAIADQAGAGPTAIWQGDGGLLLQPSSIAGAHNRLGTENAIAWRVFDQSTGTTSIVGSIQRDGGLWATPFPLSAVPGGTGSSALSFALAYDGRTGVPWVAEASAGAQLDLAPLAGSGSMVVLATPASDAGVGIVAVAALPCANLSDGGSAFCLAYSDTAATVWVGLFDPASDPAIQPVPFAKAFAGPPASFLGGLALADIAGEITVASAVGSDTQLGSTLSWATFESLGSPPSLAQGSLPIAGEPSLFAWNTAPLLVYPAPAGAGSDMALLSLGPDGGIQAPPLPVDAGVASPAQGYVDSSGDLFLALHGPSGRSVQLYELTP
ncbi:MAG: carboxypeptidase-like regulatory domain-containing protein [Myxococcales bacterium]